MGSQPGEPCLIDRDKVTEAVNRWIESTGMGADVLVEYFLALARRTQAAAIEAAVRPWEEAVQAAYDVLTVAPELHPSNYDHDQVCELNSKALEAWQILDDARALLALPVKPECGTCGGDKRWCGDLLCGSRGKDGICLSAIESDPHCGNQHRCPACANVTATGRPE